MNECARRARAAPSFPSETAIPPDEIIISPLVSRVNPCVTPGSQAARTHAWENSHGHAVQKCGCGLGDCAMDFTQAISQQECKQIAMDQAARMQGLVPDDHPGALDKNAFWRY